MNVLTPTLIGVTASLREEETHYCRCEYLTALTAQGALPVVLPVTEDEAMLRDYVQALDGFLFTGGDDVDPALFGQWQHPACGNITPQRDAHELALARLLLEDGRKPVLGICRGVQVLNVALGGELYQDIDAEVSAVHMAHRQKQPFPYHPSVQRSSVEKYPVQEFPPSSVWIPPSPPHLQIHPDVPLYS